MKKQFKRSSRPFITAGIAVVEFIILQILIHLGLAPGGVNAALSMLYTCITYFILSGILLKLHQPRNAMWVAILAFIFICIFIFYSVSLIDILTAIVALFCIIQSMLALDSLIKQVEGKDKHNGRPNEPRQES